MQPHSPCTVPYNTSLLRHIPLFLGHPATVNVQDEGVCHFQQETGGCGLWLELGLGQTGGLRRMICLHPEWEVEYKSSYKDFTGRCVVIHKWYIVLRRMVPLCLYRLPYLEEAVVN